MDPAPVIFVTDVQDTKKTSHYNFFKIHLHHFSNIKKVITKLQNSRNQDFSYYFCLMIEGSGSLTNGSGSRRPKNIRIFRIRNTALYKPNYVTISELFSSSNFRHMNQETLPWLRGERGTWSQCREGAYEGWWCTPWSPPVTESSLNIPDKRTAEAKHPLLKQKWHWT